MPMCIAEQLADEYVTQYCVNHGGNFSKKEIRNAFIKGCQLSKDVPSTYHEYVAYEQGKKQRGM